MKQDNLVMVTFTIALVFVGVSLLINTSKSCDVNIQYDATVDSNNTGITPSIAEIKLACYKLCLEHLENTDNNMKQKCLDKCEALQ